MSVRDLATLAGIIITEYPEYYTIFSEKEFTFSGIRQYARNPLLHRDVGADGLKTGHTEEAGYGLTASAVRDGRRLVMVLAGLETPGQRAREAERLLEYGFREFKTYQLFAARPDGRAGRRLAGRPGDRAAGHRRTRGADPDAGGASRRSRSR